MPMQCAERPRRCTRPSRTVPSIADARDTSQVARAGTYAVKLDPQFWYDQALERVFDAANEFEVLDLPVELTEDFTKIRKQYRKISLSVHPDKNKHPQADAAFRKVPSAEAVSSLCAPGRARRWTSGRSLDAFVAAHAASRAQAHASFMHHEPPRLLRRCMVHLRPSRTLHSSGACYSSSG